MTEKTKDEEVRLMKGNEVLAHAAIRYGADGYFGYPITPQSEVLETLDICQNNVIVIGISGHKTAGNTCHHSLERYSGSH